MDSGFCFLRLTHTHTHTETHWHISCTPLVFASDFKIEINSQKIYYNDKKFFFYKLKAVQLHKLTKIKHFEYQ